MENHKLKLLITSFKLQTRTNCGEIYMTNTGIEGRDKGKLNPYQKISGKMQVTRFSIIRSMKNSLRYGMNKFAILLVNLNTWLHHVPPKYSPLFSVMKKNQSTQQNRSNKNYLYLLLYLWQTRPAQMLKSGMREGLQRKYCPLTSQQEPCKKISLLVRMSISPTLH